MRDLKDPGFDWTLKGYQLTDLLNVAKRPDSDMLEDHYLEADCSPAMQHDTDMVKALESIGLEPMETGEAYDQQLARNPNSSKLWISYIAFFLGQKAWSSKKRYENSKVIAERAIKAIDSRFVSNRFDIFFLRNSTRDRMKRNLLFTLALSENCKTLKSNKNMHLHSTSSIYSNDRFALLQNWQI